MKVLLIFSLVIMLVSCSNISNKSSRYEDQQDFIVADAVSSDMASFNYKLRPKLMRKDKYQNFDFFDSKLYLSKMSEYQEPSEKEYADILDEKNTEVVVKGRKLEFVICIRNIKFKLYLCDKATTAIRDLSIDDMGKDINEVIDTLL